MVLLIILLVIMLLFLWIMLAPLELVVDSRVPVVHVRLISIGVASVQYRHDEFWLSIQILFMQFQWRMQDLANKKKKVREKPTRKKEVNGARALTKLLRILKGFRVKEFELRLNPSDYTVTARLYPLNFLPLPVPYKLSLSFNEDAYFMVRMKTVPWRIAHALIKK